MPQRRFLLRGSVLLAGMLVLWWLILIGPLLAGLRVVTDFSLRCLPGASGTPAARALPNGDWVFRVPVRSSWLNSPAPDSRVPKFRGVQLEIPRSSLILFTLGLPIVWALILSSPISRRLWRPLVAGTAIASALTIMQVLFFILFTISKTLHLVTNGVAAWLLDYAAYVNNNVIPYAAPFAIALCVHPGLRSAILSAEPGTRADYATAPETGAAGATRHGA
jgi:hypothetical protein